MKLGVWLVCLIPTFYVTTFATILIWQPMSDGWKVVDLCKLIDNHSQFGQIIVVIEVLVQEMVDLCKTDR